MLFIILMFVLFWDYKVKRMSRKYFKYIFLFLYVIYVSSNLYIKVMVMVYLYNDWCFIIEKKIMFILYLLMEIM